MPISLNCPHQRRAGNGSDFSHWMLDAKEEQSAMLDFAAVLSTPQKKKAENGNLSHDYQRQPSNAETPGGYETTTGLNLLSSKPNNF